MIQVYEMPQRSESGHSRYLDRADGGRQGTNNDDGPYSIADDRAGESSVVGRHDFTIRDDRLPLLFVHVVPPISHVGPAFPGKGRLTPSHLQGGHQLRSVSRVAEVTRPLGVLPSIEAFGLPAPNFPRCFATESSRGGDRTRKE